MLIVFFIFNVCCMLGLSDGKQESLLAHTSLESHLDSMLRNPKLSLSHHSSLYILLYALNVCSVEESEEGG